MAISECNNSELVGGTCAVFSCCEDRARAIIAQAEQYNYLYLLKGRIEEHELSKSIRPSIGTDPTSEDIEPGSRTEDEKGNRDESSNPAHVARFYDEGQACSD